MTIDVEALRNLLCQRLCEDVSVERRPDGDLMLHTHFRFPDGDGFPIHVSSAPGGGIRLSDRGHTLMHISYDHDVDAFMEGTRGALLERIVAESGLRQEQGAFCLDAMPDQVPGALFHRPRPHPSIPSRFDLGVETLEFGAGVVDGVLPVDARLPTVPVLRPSARPGPNLLHAGDAVAEGLGASGRSIPARPCSASCRAPG